MNRILVKGGRVVDPKNGRDEVADVLIENGKIVDVQPDIVVEGAEEIDASGKLVMPGAVDLHVHLRDLNQSNKETIATGTKAALAGGVTTVFTMPNTMPRLDDADTIKHYQDRINAEAVMDVQIVGAITEELRGEKLAAIKHYPELGIMAISDDGYDVDDESVLEDAMKLAKELDLLVIVHPEVHSINPDGVMNEGHVSHALSVPGQPNEKEYKAVERAIRLALKTGARCHLTHVSTKESVALVRGAKAESNLITCDVTPHHIALTDEIVHEIHGMGKVNPPLRTEEDRHALLTAIQDGTVDAIGTDHAPHTQHEKEMSVEKAAFGFTGLEVMLPVAFNELHHKLGIELMDVVRLLTSGPAAIAQYTAGDLSVGSTANVTIVDLDLEKKVDPESFQSMGKNTPFAGTILKGWPVQTIFQGELN